MNVWLKVNRIRVPRFLTLGLRYVQRFRNSGTISDRFLPNTKNEPVPTTGEVN